MSGVGTRATDGRMSGIDCESRADTAVDVAVPRTESARRIESCLASVHAASHGSTVNHLSARLIAIIAGKAHLGIGRRRRLSGPRNAITMCQANSEPFDFVLRIKHVPDVARYGSRFPRGAGHVLQRTRDSGGTEAHEVKLQIL